MTDANGALVGTATTDAAGNYLFKNLPLGDYTVTVDTSTVPASKLANPTGDPDSGPGDIGDSTSSVSLTPDAPDDRAQDFGYEPEPDAPTLGSIGDIIFHDADGDGIYEPVDGDFPLENVTVMLTDAAGNTQTTTTDENGFYIFTELPMGDYTVTVDPATLPAGKLAAPSADPNGGADSTSLVTLAEANPVNSEQDFGYEPEPLGSIGDLIDEEPVLNV